jgi:hypothetical protein
MSAMTDDASDRILGILTAGAATIGRLAEALGLPGGVVSYHLKRLEQAGLVRVGGSRKLRGVPTAVYVSTAATAAPPLPVPEPLPGLTWTSESRFPAPLWTVPEQPAAPADDRAWTPAPTPPEPAARDRGRTGDEDPERAETSAEATAAGRGREATAAGRGREATAAGQGRGDSPAGARRPGPPLSGNAPAEGNRGPTRGRMLEVRRIPVDDATFHEFAARLDALAREFAARATPGAPATELTIALSRPREASYGGS